MAVTINKNRGTGGATVVIHNAANGTYIVAGNNTVSNVGSPGQTVRKGVITQVWAGAQTGAHWTISRGSNVVGVYVGTVHMDHTQAPLVNDPTANIVLTLNGGAVGTIMLEVHTTNEYGE